MLTEKDLKELIKQGKIQTQDIDFEEEQQDDLQQQKIELEKQKIELQKQKLKIEKQKLEQKKDIPQEKKRDKFGIIYCFFVVFAIIVYIIVYFDMINGL